MDGFEFNFDWKRLLILAVFLVIFFLLGGFYPPEVNEEMVSPTGITRSWFYMVLLYCCGAVSVSIIDHEVGMFPPSNLRILYIILGVLLMGASAAWLYSLNEVV
ncbi:MAG: hypothetical protein GXP30_12585 [Verrucomicrobia bacterium]|nr:hypothetical protein [Verrucomicrobiota bacterium]